MRSQHHSPDYLCIICCEPSAKTNHIKKIWYDGYQLVEHKKEKEECHSMYSPKSVVEAMLRHRFGTYWNQTETYETLKIYIQMDMDGLKDSVVNVPSRLWKNRQIVF